MAEPVSREQQAEWDRAYNNISRAKQRDLGRIAHIAISSIESGGNPAISLNAPS